MRPILGGKGANLAQMAKKPLSLPVPSGFTISIDVCQEYYKLGKKYPAGLDAEVAKYLAKLEKSMGKKLGDAKDPLLVSVRSGAAIRIRRICHCHIERRGEDVEEGHGIVD